MSVKVFVIIKNDIRDMPSCQNFVFKVSQNAWMASTVYFLRIFDERKF